MLPHYVFSAAFGSNVHRAKWSPQKTFEALGCLRDKRLYPHPTLTQLLGNKYQVDMNNFLTVSCNLFFKYLEYSRKLYWYSPSQKNRVNIFNYWWQFVKLPPISPFGTQRIPNTYRSLHLSRMTYVSNAFGMPVEHKCIRYSWSSNAYPHPTGISDISKRTSSNSTDRRMAFWIHHAPQFQWQFKNYFICYIAPVQNEKAVLQGLSHASFFFFCHSLMCASFIVSNSGYVLPKCKLKQGRLVPW